MTLIKKLSIGELHPFLEKDIDRLVSAINNGQLLIDCELSELLADINQCESCRIIDSYTANTLRDYYIRGGWRRG